MVKLIPLAEKGILMETFIESQFSHCPFISMFYSKKMNRKINHIHKSVLRLVYKNCINDLLKKIRICMHSPSKVFFAEQ